MHVFKTIGKFFIFPTFFYFVFFAILTYPAILSFSTSVFADTGDGLQNVWNIWWVNKAVTQLHQSIWQTYYLHYPYGTTLIGHTLNPLNGLIGIFLLKFLPLLSTYNVILTFSFVASGLATFLLAFYLTKNYLGATVAGFIYTFSNFHFAHAQGHLQTVSMEWIPLFILLWLMFLKKPGFILALASGVVLYFNLLCDYYFFFYCILAAAIFYFWQAYVSHSLLLKKWKEIISAGLVFLIVLLLSSGKLITALFIQNQRDPLFGAHPASMFSTDLFSLFIPGGHWRFANLTSTFWLKLPGNIHESSISLGVSVIVMLVYVWFARKKIKDKSIISWYIVFLFFLILSFGPNLQIMGNKINNFLLPYGFLEKTIPFLNLSGMPIRMMVMVILSSAIIVAYGLKHLTINSTKHNIFITVFLLFLFIEYLPLKIPITEIIVPLPILKLKTLSPGAVLDMLSSPSMALYYQTIYEKPLALGYIARTPVSVLVHDFTLLTLLKNKNYDVLCKEYGFKYLLTGNTIDIPVTKMISSDKDMFLFALDCT